MPAKASLIERVYLDIKRELSEGALTPGKRVDIGALCVRVGASKSPVRNALNRLVGEGLLETHAHDGFYRPLVTEARLRDLYRWNQSLLLMAIDAVESDDATLPAPSKALEGDDIVATTEQLFTAIATLAQSGELLRAVDNANLRLRPIRALRDGGQIERHTELTALAEAYRGSRFRELRTLIAEYHALRLQMAPQIVASAYRDGHS